MQWYIPRSSANAKINLALHVTGQRDDGYHLLDSLVVFTTFGDELHISQADADTFATEGPFAAELSATDDQDNLVIRARDAIRHAITSAGGKAFPVSIRLVKNIPVASGMGGGSADAATAIRLLRQLWNADRWISAADIDQTALSLGADLPMCLTGPQPLHVTGIGDEIDPVSNVPRFHVLLVNPGVAVSTPAVFAALQSRQNGPLPNLPGDRANAPYPTDRKALLDWLAAETRNDLQDAAIRIAPQIETCLEALTSAGATFARMTGSGATCFGLFETESEAMAAQAAVASKHPTWFCMATQTLGSRPNRYGDVGKWLD